MLTTARDLLILLVAIGGAATVAVLLYEPATAVSDPGPEASQEAIELAKHPFFDGKISPQQAEKLIQAAMQLSQFEPWDTVPYPMNCLPNYTEMDFNDRGDFFLSPGSVGIHFPYKMLPGERLTKEQEHIKQEGERLRAASPQKLNPERWGKNSRPLGQGTMQWYRQKYIPGDTAHNHKLAATFIRLAIEHHNSTPGNPYP
jgi:hypothetical protein